jgi:hypothetical protein
MTKESTERPFDYFVILPHASEPRVLMLFEQAGWSLPHFTLPERHMWQDVHHVNQAVRDQLRVDATTLRCLRADYDRQTQRVRKVFIMENHSSAWALPKNGRWIGLAELDKELVLTAPEQRRLLEEWFAWAANAGRSELRAPWYKPGWFKIAASWIHEQLVRLGLSMTAPAEQLRSWERSALLRVKTDTWYFYFKAVPHMFAHEPGLTKALSEKYPAHFPDVVAVDPERHWLLMKDVKGKQWDQMGMERWEEGLRRYAQIQIDVADELCGLLALGCPDRRVEKLIAQVDSLLADTAAMLPDQAGGLLQSEITQLRALTPRLKAMLAQLADYRIPQTLEHGDLWPGQIVFHDDIPVFIDWSDSSVSHPFFSLNFLSDPIEMQPFLATAPDTRARLRDAYLEPWTLYAPMDQLREIYELSDLLAPLHHAVIYHQGILPWMEIKWEMERMLPFYLRKLLHHFGSHNL